MDRKILFAGVARDVEASLPAVRANIEMFAQSFADHGLVLVENDSRDGTRNFLRAWTTQLNAQKPGRAVLIEGDGLDQLCPKRTERIALCRNRYMTAIADSDFRHFDYLAVLDMDSPNAHPASAGDFRKAVEFLEAHPDVAGVFANAMPLYYDIWALREKSWCPGDCWQESRLAVTQHELNAAIKKNVHARQIFVDPARDPIAVDSAFGGLAIYRMAAVLNTPYVGVNAEGGEVCEHVAFHQAIGAAGGKFFILPFLLNTTCFEHTALPASHCLMPLAVGQRSANLLAAKDHPLANYRAQYPLYDERLPQLAALYSRLRDGAILDIGANIGDGLALARLHGCTSHYICVEGHEPYFMLLCANAVMHRPLFGSHSRIHKFAKFGEAQSAVVASAGTASLVSAVQNDAVPADKFAELSDFDDGSVGLVKLDTDGNDAGILLRNIDYLKRKRPVLWAEAEIHTPEALAAWHALLPMLAEIYEHVIVFDNFGFAMSAGTVAQSRDAVALLLRYVFNRQAANRASFGNPTISYLDLAFFSAADADLYRAFRDSLKELQA